MKIYITTIFPSSIKNKLTNFKDLELKTSHKYEMTSEDFGVHYIEKSKNGDHIYRMEPSFEPKFQLIKNFGETQDDLLLDSTKYIVCPVVSQLPVKYILTKLTILEYQSGRK